MSPQEARQEIVSRAWKTGGSTYLLGSELVTITLTARNTPFVTYEDGRHGVLEPLVALKLVEFGLDLSGGVA